MDLRNITPQQNQELQEKIKHMSPEELKQFQKQQCIFCHIIRGKIPSKKIYEDDKVIAIMDINPANPGHLLLLPKEHYVIMPNMPEEDMAHIFMVAKSLSNAMLKVLKAKGTNIFVANGIAAGQKAQHFIVHVIPREDDDNLNLTIKRNEMDINELAKIKAIILPAINKMLGVIDVTAGESEKVKVVDAKFEDKIARREDEKPEENVKKEDIKKGKKKKKAEVKEDEVNLDDIANLFG